MDDCIVVTGGAGFIGCAISERLAATGLPVIAIDKLAAQIHPTRQRPAALSSQVDLWIDDICDSAVWERLLSRYRPALIVHLCAETGTGQSLSESALHTHTNITGTACMLDAMSRQSIEPDKIVLASSRAVYGEGKWVEDGTEFYPLRRSHEQLLRHEWTPRGPKGGFATALPHRASSTNPNPSSIYGATKLAQEHILSAWCSARGTELGIVRIQNAYGPGQSPTNPYTGIINLFHRVARSGRPIPVYEDGEIGRDFIFIDDVANALIAATQVKLAGDVVDLGTGTRTTILAAAETIARLHDAPPPVVTGQFRDGDIRTAHADASVLRDRLGITPKVGIETGLAAVGEWLVKMGHA